MATGKAIPYGFALTLSFWLILTPVHYRRRRLFGPPCSFLRFSPRNARYRRPATLLPVLDKLEWFEPVMIFIQSFNHQAHCTCVVCYCCDCKTLVIKPCIFQSLICSLRSTSGNCRSIASAILKIRLIVLVFVISDVLSFHLIRLVILVIFIS